MRYASAIWGLFVLVIVYAGLLWCAARLLDVEVVSWRRACGLASIYVLVRALDEAVWSSSRSRGMSAGSTLRGRVPRD